MRSLRLGLRARTSAVLAAGALGVAALLAVSTYQLTRESLLAERERTAVRAAYFDAAVVRQGLTGETTGIVDVLRRLDTGQSRRPLLFRDGQWYARNADTGFTAAVPADLRRLASSGRPGVQRVQLNGTPTLVVGVPLADTGSTYYELSDQGELQRTLRQLAGTLIGVAVITAVAAALLGLWASRRILRPLTSVTGAARQLAGGDLSARLRETADPDLAPLTAAFNGMVAELSASIERDRRFASDVSHELRSPLQTLSAASSVLQGRAGALDSRSAAAAELVVAEVSRFGTLVTDLLELARAEQPVHLQPVPVAELVHRLSLRQGVSPGLVDVSPADLIWLLDVRRYERIVDNLLENAHRHAGGVVAVRVEVIEDALRLQVDDQGPGVPPEERTLVFDRFGRGHRASARGASGPGVDGTGLGLALVAQHVAALEGTVEVRDRPGGGARFEVTVPRRLT